MPTTAEVVDRPPCVGAPEAPGGRRDALAPWRALAAMQRRRWSPRLLRTILTAALGISFLAGTLMLTDIVRASVLGMLDRASTTADVVVRPTPLAGLPTSRAASMDIGRLPQSLAEDLRRVAGVADARAVVQGHARLVGADGKAVSSVGTSSLAASWTDDPALNPFHVVEGRPPVADDEIVIDRAAASTSRLTVGARTTVLAPEPVPVTVTGIVAFGDRDSAVGVTYLGLSLSGAQHVLLGAHDEVSSIFVVAEPGTDHAALAGRIDAGLRPGTEAVTGEQLTEERRRSVDEEFLDVFRQAMLAFGAVAVLVAAFSVHNSMAILSAGRRRDQARLRTLGATRRQLLVVALVDLLVIGALAAGLGLLLGVGFAGGLLQAFARAGVDLPSTTLALSRATVVVSIGVGVIATVLAGLGPALRSASATPLDAVRTAEHRASGARRRELVAGGVAVIGVGVLLSGRGGPPVAVLAAVGALAGTIAALPALAGPAATVVGRPVATVARASGRLAARNVARQPGRTATAATAMLIGVSVVVTFTVLASSLRASVDRQVAHDLSADLVLSSGDLSGRSGFSATIPARIGALASVDRAVGIGGSAVQLGGQLQAVTFTEPAGLASMMSITSSAGSFGDVRAGTLAVSNDLAARAGWRVGSEVAVTFVGGTTATMTIAATYPPAPMLTDVTMVRGDPAVPTTNALDNLVLVQVRPGVDPSTARHDIEAALRDHPEVEVLSQQEFAAEVTGQIGQIVSLVYVMLALAVAVAVMGIGASTALTLGERTNELGLLRLVGQTRRGISAMIRAEAVITALVGTTLGTALGLVIGWGFVHAVARAQLSTFAVAPVPIVVIVAAGAASGVLASAGSAHRATRLDPLAAVAAD